VADWPRSSRQEEAVLAACLSLKPPGTEELAERIAATGWERLLTAADERRLGNVLAAQLEQLGLVPQVPALVLPDGRLTVPAALERRRREHVDARSRQRERLLELVGVLNGHGIVPMLLKGARSLWLEDQRWRSMRDLDLLISDERVKLAQATAKQLGYFEREAAPRGHHHMPNLYRDDLPGWLEFHDRAGVPRVEALLGTRELWAAADVAEGMAGQVRLPPPGFHILHAMLHHHIGHRGDKGTGISLKGLYEFAQETAGLGEIERIRMIRRAARHPRLLAIMDLWTAAAADRFAMPVEPPLMLAVDAQQWWARRRSQVYDAQASPRHERLAEMEAATNQARLARLAHPMLRHPLPARLAILWSFVQRPRL
jgi:hypothetical protein